MRSRKKDVKINDVLRATTFESFYTAVARIDSTETKKHINIEDY